MELIPCADYDKTNHKCKAGHVQIMPMCWGKIEHSCPNCDHVVSVPQCLKDDPPTHLIRDDGMPLFWSDKEK